MPGFDRLGAVKNLEVAGGIDTAAARCDDLQRVAILQEYPIVVFQPALQGESLDSARQGLAAVEVILFLGNRLPVELGTFPHILVRLQDVAGQGSPMPRELLFIQFCLDCLHEGLHGRCHGIGIGHR